MTRTAEELTALWVPLLNRLTETLPDWGLWKNADAALSGEGDFDSMAPAARWDQITREFTEWAIAHGFSPVAACREVPGVLFLIALDKENATFLELDVNARKYFRGSTCFEPGDISPLMELDDKGFRRVRPGAEGVILLTQNGLKWGGAPNEAGLKKRRVREVLQSDPEGVRKAASLFGFARGSLVKGAEAAMRGSWDRRAMMTVEARALLGAVAEPQVLWTRFQAKQVKKDCPLLTAIFTHDRTIYGDPDKWIAEVAKKHEVYYEGYGR